MMRFKILMIIFLSVGFFVMTHACSKKTEMDKELDNLLHTDREFSQFSVENGAADLCEPAITEQALLCHPAKEIIGAGVGTVDDHQPLFFKIVYKEACLSGFSGTIDALDHYERITTPRVPALPVRIKAER